MAIELNEFATYVLANPCFGFVGTVNEVNQPVMTRLFGFNYDNPITTFTVYTFKNDALRLVDHLSKKTKLSATISNAMDFKTLQFKGTYHDHYDAPDEEMHYPREFNSKQAEIMQMLGISNEAFANWKYEPAMAVVMNVVEIFDQTPKVGTGNKIN